MTANSTIDLSALGLDSERLLDLVVDRICEQFLNGDNEEGEYGRERVSSRLNDQIKKGIDARVDAIAAEHVLPRVEALVTGWQLQQTSSWGEKKGEPVSFTEYLVKRSEAWISETVNYDGKPKGNDGYSWIGKQTRLAWMIDQHLQYHISAAMKNALATITASLGKSISDTVKIQLDQLKVKFDVQVS